MLTDVSFSFRASKLSLILCNDMKAFLVGIGCILSLLGFLLLTTLTSKRGSAALRSAALLQKKLQAAIQEKVVFVYHIALKVTGFGSFAACIH